MQVPTVIERIGRSLIRGYIALLEYPLRVKRQMISGMPEVGLIFPNQPLVVVKMSAMQLDMTDADRAKRARLIYKSLEELTLAGWVTD